MRCSVVHLHAHPGSTIMSNHKRGSLPFHRTDVQQDKRPLCNEHRPERWSYPDTDIVGPGDKGARPPNDGDRALPEMYDIVLCSQPPLLAANHQLSLADCSQLMQFMLCEVSMQR